MRNPEIIDLRGTFEGNHKIDGFKEEYSDWSGNVIERTRHLFGKIVAIGDPYNPMFVEAQSYYDSLKRNGESFEVTDREYKIGSNNSDVPNGAKSGLIRRMPKINRLKERLGVLV